jgi:hypothetical protein
MVLAALTGGCSFSADFGGGHFRCQSDGECPDGVSCASGFCGGNQPASDGSAGDGPVANACPGGTLLVDGFDGAVLDASLWTGWTEGAATVGLDRSRLDVTANDIDVSAGVYSVAGLPLDESSLVVEVIAPDDYSSSTMGIELIETGSPDALVTLCRDNFDLISMVGAEQDSTLFSPADHHFWRIQEVGDQIRFSTSGDGAVWFELFAASSVGLPAEVRLSLWGQNYATVTPLVLSFGSATWCKMKQ